MHWADAFIQKIEGPQVISTGISPSGPIHVGNMREILTGDIVFRAARSKGLPVKFIFLSDDIDPLRKVYPFLDESFREHVGKPLYEIPSPKGEGTYADHFMAPFRDSLEKLHIQVEILRSSQLYESGKFYEVIKTAIAEKDRIARILREVSGRELEENWFPYSPKCSSCGKINQATATSFTDPYVSYNCKCGHSGKSDIRKGEGKLPWRVEWPAKWHLLGVTIESFGKDHGSAGGAYDSGKRIVEEVFGTPAPSYLIYERILLKGEGAMHSSTGIVIESSEALRFMPPESLRFLIARNSPLRHIEFDPKDFYLNFMDDYEKYFNAYFKKDTVSDPDLDAVVRYSSLEKPVGPIEPSFRHLVTLVQIYPDEKKLLHGLSLGGYAAKNIAGEMGDRIALVKYWLDNYAPESIKFSLLPRGTEVKLETAEQDILKEFLSQAESLNWTAQSIHDSVRSISLKDGGEPMTAFRAFYRVLIGKDRGPRLGFFLSEMDKKWVIDRLGECLS